LSIPLDDASRDKVRAASVSLATNGILTSVKLVGAVFTGSVGLLSVTFHSAADLVGSLLVLAAVRVAAVPPDEDHPYGHAKVESIAGLAEAAALALLGLYVVAEGVEHLWYGVAVRNIGAGVLVAAGCSAISGIAGAYIRSVGKRTNSAALRANGFHMLSDLATSGGVALALLAVKYTGARWADGTIGIALGAWLMVSAQRVGNDAFQQLIDRRLSDNEIIRIRELVSAEKSVISFHRLRTRLSGNVRYIDFHVVVPNTWSVVEAHQLADRLEHVIRDELSPATIVIHVDPYDEEKATRGRTSS
jgi:cation diffusion facilitator family transporter